MPTNLVHTEHDEKLWRQAKALAAKNGHKENWGYVVSIYQSMKGKGTPKQAAIALTHLNPTYIAGRLAIDSMSKQAGFWTAPRLSLMDKIIRHLPDFMKPGVQGVVARFKYPELYSILSARSHRSALERDKIQGLMRAIMGENSALAKDLAHSKAEGAWNLIYGPRAPQPFSGGGAGIDWARILGG